MRKKDAKKKHRIRHGLISAVLSLSLLLSSCSSKLNSPKLTVPKVAAPEVSVKNSVTQTAKRLQVQLESIADYYSIYKRFEDRLEEREDKFTYAKQKLVISSLKDYSYLTRNREIDFVRYEKIENFITSIGEKTFKDVSKEIINDLDFVIAFKQDMRSRFYRDEQKRKGITSRTKSYISGLTNASEMEFRFRPSIRDEKINLRGSAELKNALYLNRFKIDAGTDILKIRLAKHLNENTLFAFKYSQNHNLFEYEGDRFEDRKKELTTSLSIDIFENTRATFGLAYLREKEKGDKTREYRAIEFGLTQLF